MDIFFPLWPKTSYLYPSESMKRMNWYFHGVIALVVSRTQHWDIWDKNLNEELFTLGCPMGMSMGNYLN